MTSTSTDDLFHSIQASANGLTLAELMTVCPGIARRTAQRLIAKLIQSGKINASGEGRIRQHAVEIGKSVYRPLSATQQIEEALDVLLKKANQHSAICGATYSSH